MSGVVSDRVATQLGEVALVVASDRNVEEILRLRDRLARWMVESGIEQWRPGDMPRAWIDECIAHGWIFLARRGGELLGSVTLVETDPFIWGDRNGPAGYVHMLMVDRAYADVGLGRSLLAWAEGRIARSGHRRARLDCVGTNAGLRAYYEEAGYVCVGARDFAGGIPSVALYEKQLGP